MRCIVCLKKLTHLWEDIPNIKDGIDFVIVGGYGSRHDMDAFNGYICDECVTNINELGIINHRSEDEQ